MKYFKRLGLYKAANVTLNPKTIEAHSYAWWCFVKVIKGKTVFNWYMYSNTTRKHQHKVAHELRRLGFNVDVEVNVKESLKDHDTIEDLVNRSRATVTAQHEARAARKRELYKRNKERKALEKRTQATIDRVGPKVIEDAKKLVNSINLNTSNVVPFRKAV
jgi:hypothetical protein